MLGAMLAMPATTAEQERLGPDAAWLKLVQMRAARTMLRVAPEFSVDALSQMTELPPSIMLAYLQATADGKDIATQSAQPTGRSVGTAKFVQVD